MNIFVGNLSFDAKEADLHKAFVGFGTVASVVIVMEKKGKKSRGFGFVEMPDEQEAKSAIAALHGRELLGRPINVMPSLPKKPRNKPVGVKQVAYFQRTGRFKEGRRSLSYAKRQATAGITVPVSERKYKPNPLRWRKQPRRFGTYQKTEGEPNHWDKAAGKSKPWRKSGNAIRQPGYKKRKSFTSHKK
jgi:RNA recognition motif-containing protein